jgi:hypothetical protein
MIKQQTYIYTHICISMLTSLILVRRNLAFAVYMCLCILRKGSASIASTHCASHIDKISFGMDVNALPISMCSQSPAQGAG